MVRPHEAVHQLDALGPAEIDQRPRFGGGRRQRLFAQDVLAALGGLARPFVVQRVGQRNVDRVDLRIVEQRFVAAVRRRECSPPAAASWAFSSERLAMATQLGVAGLGKRRQQPYR